MPAAKAALGDTLYTYVQLPFNLARFNCVLMCKRRRDREMVAFNQPQSSGNAQAGPSTISYSALNNDVTKGA